jgi:hypothetical protein
MAPDNFQRPGPITQQEIERMAVMESTLRQLSDEVEELLKRKFPWIQVIFGTAPIIVIALGFSFQNLLQLQIVAERQVQYQRSLETLMVEKQKQLDNLSLEDKDMKRRLEAIERKLRI